MAAGFSSFIHPVPTEFINMLFLNFLAGDKLDTRQTLRFSLVGDEAYPYLPNGFLLTDKGFEGEDYRLRWARADARSFAPPD